MQNDLLRHMIRPWRNIFAVSVALTSLSVSSVTAAADADSAPPGRTLGFALTGMHWSIYQTPNGKSECPNGLNGGSREEIAMQFPQTSGKVYTLEEVDLNREIATWHPDVVKYNLPFKEAQGKISIGLNLDGKVGANDYTSPDGETGVDNQLFRVIGCVEGWRSPNGVIDVLGLRRMFKSYRYNRILMELTGVDSLTNDPDVEVATYRGLDPLLTDASGDTIMPGGSQRIDVRYGAKFISHRHGKIVDGVLITDPADWTFPEYAPTSQLMRDARFRLKLSATTADGVIGGYADIKDWHRAMMGGWGTTRSSLGLASGPSHARALERLADAYPDPQTGKNTAISAALDAHFVQVFIQHPEKAVSDKDSEKDNLLQRAVRH